MIYIGYSILFFGFVRLMVALVNSFTKVYLPQSVSLKEEPLVSILIPARNEENNIGTILSDIQKITYSYFEVWVYNDLSTDQTQQIVEQYALEDPRIHLIQGKEPEEGWLGKNFGCFQLSQYAKGEYFLFLDADVGIQNELIQKCVYLMQKQKLRLLSIFPKQILDNRGSQLSVPLMNWILLSLLPLILVRLSGWVSFSAANGQFLFFDAKEYQNRQPHYTCRNDKAEDMAICRYYKKNRLNVSTLLGNDDIQCNMYPSLQEAINGFSKNIFSFFGNSFFACLLFAFFTTFSPVIVFLIFGFKILIFYILSIIIIRMLISVSSQQSVLRNIVYLPFQHLVFLKIILNAFIKQKNNSLYWKGRRI